MPTILREHLSGPLSPLGLVPWAARAISIRQLAAVAFTLVFFPSLARAAAKPAPLKEGVSTRGILDVESEEPASFRFEVPKEAVLMTVALTQSPLILDILARKDKPLASVDDAEHRSSAEVLDNTLRISRQGSPALQEGTYYIEVTYLGSTPPVLHKRPVKKVPFTIAVSLVRAKIDGVLTPGKKTAGQIRAEEGSVRSFAIDVPAEANALRIDLDEVSSDLDILARYGEPLVRNQDAADTAISPLGRESLVIDRSSPQPLRPGRWCINVVHPADFGTVDFAIYASFSPDPPPELLVIPKLPLPADPRKRTIQATVDLSTEYGGASGTLLGEDGLILTNYHVVAEVAENAEERDPVIIAATIHPQEPPRELFRGRVVMFDKTLDLALIQTTCGFYRQPLPRGYRFPFLPLGDSAALEIGDRVSIVGFPAIGGTAGRVSVTLTQGVVSGFEQTPIGVLIKTDANISPGSSGGAALDDQWRLIGVPTSENVRPEAVSRMSYIHPVSLIPGAWRKMIQQRQGTNAESHGSRD
jgi:hypothetical protein